MQMKKFVDIERIKSVYAESFNSGEHIVIQTKIDGSNASIRYNEETNSLAAFSRRQELTEMNTLNGFWNFVETLPVEIFKEVLGTRYIIFGEWMTKHCVIYPDSMYKKFYMYDVYDTEIQQYLTQTEAYSIYEKLSDYIEGYIHTLYDGPFVSWEHTLKFLEENTYGETPCMEGIIIKRQDVLDSKSSRNPFYVKVVNERFSEVHNSKPKKIDPNKLAAREAEKAKVETVVTPQRIEKMLMKLIDENIIPEDWDSNNMKDISRILPKEIFNDCRKEENEIVISCENFGKLCAGITMTHIRKMLDNKSKLI